MEKGQNIINEWEENWENEKYKVKYRMIKLEDGTLIDKKIYHTEIKKEG